MSANEPRKLLGQSRAVGSRAMVYQVADGLELEVNEQYDVVHKRVLFDDVMLVTIHREIGMTYLLTTGFVTAFFFGFAFLFLVIDINAWMLAATFAVLGLPTAIMMLMRWFTGVIVVTVFGRRSKAAIHFTRRKDRAREVYGSICAAVRNAQRRAAASEPE
ncbi:MAG TPA: hypothetical protein VEK79_03165 [Thermoanaerobaculia bacterium]|nr:hypothetical protein [Thermoanaerobaculia bacterium]